MLLLQLYFVCILYSVHNLQFIHVNGTMYSLQQGDQCLPNRKEFEFTYITYLSNEHCLRHSNHIYPIACKQTCRANCPKSYNRIENNHNKWNGIKRKMKWEKIKTIKVRSLIELMMMMMVLLWFHLLYGKTDYFSHWWL